MMDAASPEPPRPLYLKMAALFGAALVLGLGALVPLLAHDRTHRPELESTSQTTAVGDNAFLKHRTRGPAPQVTSQGRLLVPPSPRHLEIKDNRMTQAGAVDDKSVRLYTTKEKVPWESGEVEDKSRPVFYLKVENNEYLRVQ